MFEYLLTLFRLEERARAFFLTTILNVLVDDRADGRARRRRRRGRPRAAAGQLRQRRRLRAGADRRPVGAASRCGSTVALLRRLLRFGLPTMPAELSLYLLNFVDRIIIVRSAGLAAGRPLLAGGQVRPGRQRPRPRLPARLAAARLLDPRRRRGAPRLRRDRHLVRRRLRLRRHRHVAALALDRAGAGGAAVLRLLQGDRPDRHRRHPLRPLHGAASSSSAAPAAPSFNFPAAIAALLANVALNLALVPPLGIVGAGIALVASYLVVLALMYGFTQRLFPVPFEWARLARVVLVSAVLVGVGEWLLPDRRPRRPRRQDRALARLPARPPRGRLLHRRGAPLARPPAPARPACSPPSAPCAPPRPRSRGTVPEAYEAELMDEDARI